MRDKMVVCRLGPSNHATAQRTKPHARLENEQAQASALQEEVASTAAALYFPINRLRSSISQNPTRHIKPHLTIIRTSYKYCRNTVAGKNESVCGMVGVEQPHLRLLHGPVVLISCLNLPR